MIFLLMVDSIIENHMERNTIGARSREATRRKPLRALSAQRSRLNATVKEKRARKCAHSAPIGARARDLTRARASSYCGCSFSLLTLIFAPINWWSASVTVASMCIHPLPAWISGETKNGKPRLVFSSPFQTFFAPAYYLPCGKCLGCQVDRRNRWISRMQLEHYCHDNVGTFITLTYRDPAPPRLVKKDVQNFLKRFRNLPRDLHIDLPDFKYFFCGEYGSKFGRPHYHGLLFGIDCFNPVFDSVIVDFKNGYPVFSSKVLSDTWKHGFITVDKITTSNIRYVSKYILKNHQKHGDEFILKSIGLGADFFFDFPTEKRSLPVKGCFFNSYERGILHFPNKNGKMSLLPIPTKAFDRYVEIIDPVLLKSLKDSRRSYYVKHTPTVEDYRRRSQWLDVMTAEKPNERKLDNDS